MLCDCYQASNIPKKKKKKKNFDTSLILIPFYFSSSKLCSEYRFKRSEVSWLQTRCIYHPLAIPSLTSRRNAFVGDVKRAPLPRVKPFSPTEADLHPSIFFFFLFRRGVHHRQCQFASNGFVAGVRLVRGGWPQENENQRPTPGTTGASQPGPVLLASWSGVNGAVTCFTRGKPC